MESPCAETAGQWTSLSRLQMQSSDAATDFRLCRWSFFVLHTSHVDITLSLRCVQCAASVWKISSCQLANDIRLQVGWL